MICRHLIFILTLALTGSHAFAEFSEGQLYKTDFDPCKSWNAKDWDRFKNWTMQDYPNEDLMQPRLQTFREFYGKCQPGFSDPNMTACLERMDYIGKITLNAFQSRIHSWKSNFEYFAGQNQELVTLPPEFAGGLPENWRDIAKEKGWMCVNFKSKLRTAVAEGDAMYRTIILRPMTVDGKQVMQRILVTSQTPDPTKETATFQIITTEHQYDGRNDGMTDKGARMNYRAYELEGSHMNQSKTNMSCAECHMTGPIRVKPDPAYQPNFCGDYDLAAFNDKLLNDSTMPNQENVRDLRLHPQADMGNFPISKDGLVGVDGPGAKHCIDCHTEWGGVRNPLAVAMNYGHPLSRLPLWAYEIDVHKNMPPGITLSKNEWEKAKELLLKEQISGVRSWLLGKTCDKAPRPAPTGVTPDPAKAPAVH